MGFHGRGSVSPPKEFSKMVGFTLVLCVCVCGVCVCVCRSRPMTSITGHHMVRVVCGIIPVGVRNVLTSVRV